MVSSVQSGPITPIQLTCIGEVSLDASAFERRDTVVLSSCRTGAEALGRAPADCAGIALLHERLPDMASLECLRRLKAIGSPSRVYWVAKAARRTRLLSCFMAGADGLLVNPVSLGGVFAREEARAAGFDVQRFARGRGLSLRCLERQFQVDYDSSPKKTLNRWRLEEACRLLGQGFAAKVVATSLGFHDSCHFHRAFRRAYSMTPGEYVAACTASKRRP